MEAKVTLKYSMSPIFKSGTFSKDFYDLLEQIMPSLQYSQESKYYAHSGISSLFLQSYAIFNEIHSNRLREDFRDFIGSHQYPIKNSTINLSELGYSCSFNMVFFNTNEFKKTNTIAKIYLAKDGNGGMKDDICLQIDLECHCPSNK